MIDLYTANTGNGHYGGLQFKQATWESHGGVGNPAHASKQQQIAVANRVLATQGPGAWPKCGKAGGLRRLALTDADKEMRDLFITWCTEAGCRVSVDRVGNIFARRPGQDDHLPPVLMGSHLDTQFAGGKYDGIVGVLAGLEVLRTLDDRRVRTRRPLELVCWTNEEGARFTPPMVASGAFAAENVEVQLDKLAGEIQSLRELIARSPRFGIGSSLSDLALPEPRAAVSNQLLGVTAAGDGFEYKVPANLSFQTVSSYIGTLLDDADAATARATLGIGSTVDLNLLTTDTTGGAHGDFVPFVDVSESNASNKTLVSDLFSNAIGNSTDTSSPSPSDIYRVLARKSSDGTLHRIPTFALGTGKQTVWVPAGSMTCIHGGQGCATTTRLLVPKEQLDAATEIAKATLESIPVGDPFDERGPAPLPWASGRRTVP